jgi:hypothetical protein
VPSGYVSEPDLGYTPIGEWLVSNGLELVRREQTEREFFRRDEPTYYPLDNGPELFPEPVVDEFAAWAEQYERQYPDMRCQDFRDRGEHFSRNCGASACPWTNRVYASGYTKGSWSALPDGFLSRDDELKDVVHDMAADGYEDSEIYEQWERLANAEDPSDLWTERDFTRHLSGARRKLGTAYERSGQAEHDGWSAMGIDVATITDQQLEQPARFTTFRTKGFGGF